MVAAHYRLALPTQTCSVVEEPAEPRIILFLLGFRQVAQGFIS